jgi:hypothetical protein
MIERDAQQVFSHDGWTKCAEFGVQTMPVPKEYGARGADPITTIAMIEELGCGGLDQGLLFSIKCSPVDQFHPAAQIWYGRIEEEISSQTLRWKSHRRQRRQRTDSWIGYFFDADSRQQRWQ